MHSFAHEITQYREDEAPAEPRETAEFSSISAARQEPRAAENTRHFVEIDEELPPEEVSQQFTRTTAADGRKSLPVGCGFPSRPASARKTLIWRFALRLRHAGVKRRATRRPRGPHQNRAGASLRARLDLKLPPSSESPVAIVLHFTARAEGKKNES